MGVVEAMRSDAAGPWDFGYMEFVILLDTQIGNGQLNIQIGGSGEKSGVGDINMGVVHLSTVWTVNLDEIIQEAREEKCEDRVLACASI